MTSEDYFGKFSMRSFPRLMFSLGGRTAVFADPSIMTYMKMMRSALVIPEHKEPFSLN